MAFPLERLPTLVAAVAMLGLALWIMSLKFSDRLHRAFALFLFLRALFYGLVPFSSPVNDYEGRIMGYTMIAIPFAGLHFAYAFWRRHRGSHRRLHLLVDRLEPWSLVALAAGFETLYLLRHDLLVPLYDPGGPPGPLILFLPLTYATYALIALAIGYCYTRPQNDHAARAFYALSLGFALEPLFLPTLLLLEWSNGPANPGAVGVAENAIRVATLALVAVLGLLIVRHARQTRQPKVSGRAVRFLVLLALPIGSALLAFSQFEAGNPAVAYWTLTTSDAGWHLALVFLAAYAIVRHRFLDLDLHIQHTVRRGTLAAPFVLAFLVTTELAENYFDSRFGWVFGALAMGLLLFLLLPIQKLAERFAQLALPHATPIEDLSPSERANLYEEQLRLAWRDGNLTRKERRMLEAIRQRLGLSVDEAARMEREAVG